MKTTRLPASAEGRWPCVDGALGTTRPVPMPPFRFFGRHRSRSMHRRGRQAVRSSSRRPDDLTAKRIRTRISEEALEAGKQVRMLGTLTGRWAGPEVTAALPCKGAEARRVPGVVLGQGHRGTSEEGGLFLHEAYNPGDK